ncbi:MAG TPA: carbohydrate kinase, partial [Alistipes sp.]|nr:carbohydrate kinase [Alistipes sp.]
FDTDGALGAARGAALGAGLYKSREEAFASLKRLEVIEPEAADREALEASYERWKQALERRLS